jgi:hypothetical protein
VGAQIVWRLYRHLKKRDHSHRSSRVFGAISSALGVGFILSTILLVTSHTLELEFVSKVIRTSATVNNELSTIDHDFPIGYTPMPMDSGFCYPHDPEYLQGVLSILDIALEKIFQLTLIVGDSPYTPLFEFPLTHFMTSISPIGSPMLDHRSPFRIGAFTGAQ